VGLRPSQALALKWSDLDFKEGNFVVVRGFVDGMIGDPKSIASRNRVEMHKALGAVMLEWRKQTIYAADDDYIYASERKNGTQPRLGSMISTDHSPSSDQGEGHRLIVPKVRLVQHAPRLGDFPRGERHGHKGDPADATLVECPDASALFSSPRSRRERHRERISARWGSGYKCG
jgi:hypothetical protein